MRTAAFLSVVCAASPSLAQDSAVEALIQRGIQLRRESNDNEALAVFLEAEKQAPESVRVLLHVVTAAQASGKWLLADSYMRKVSRLSHDSYYQRHAEAIDVVRRSIAQRVGTFQVQGSPDGASVRLDGELVGTLPMNEPAPVQAGAYLMEVHKPGFYRLRRNVTIVGGVLTREPVELNRAVARGDLGAGPGALAAGPGGEGAVGADSANESWLQSPVLGWTLIGLGAAAGVASGISFVIREERADRWNDESRCIPDNGSTRVAACQSFKDDAEAAQNIGIATGVAAAVFAGAGIIQLITSGGGSEESSAAASSGPKLSSCGAGFLSVACYGSF